MDKQTMGEMHVAQMRILSMLGQSKSAHFSELAQTTKLTSDHANFHIKKLIACELIEHMPKAYGEYRLTKAGKQYVTRMNTLNNRLEQLPKISVVLSVSNKDGRILRQQRLKQPYYGYWSRPTGKVQRGETIVAAATRKLLEETGLAADWNITGIEHRIDHGIHGDLYDDKYLFMVQGTNPRGTLIAEKAGMHNYWMTESEYKSKDKRFGKPQKAETLLNAQTIDLNEGIFTFDEDAF